jgi:hypothetical protein
MPSPMRECLADQEKHNPPGAIAYFLGRHRPRMRTIQ